MSNIFINIKSGDNSFDVTSVGLDTEKQYTVSEFNQALKKANEKWQENWDGLSYPSNIIVVTVENLHNEPCTYRVNLTDADYNSIQDIVDLSPTPMHASIPTEKAIEVLNKAEVNAREQGLDTAEQDKTFAYNLGHSAPFTVVLLDIRKEERRYAVSEALKDIIDAYTDANGRTRDGVQPYKNLLESITPKTDFLHASQGHLNCLKYALRNAHEDKELRMSMLESIKQAENNLTSVVTIKGYECIPKDTWEDHGVTYKIGQCVDDMSFYYARATDGTVTRDYEYDHEPSREKVMSDHADKLAEEAIDRHEAEYGADGRRAFPDVQNNMVENIPQQQDISHNTNNAALSAAKANGQKRSITMSNNTKLSVSSMTILGDDSSAKAYASVTINDEFAIKNIRVFEGKNGLFVTMPSRKSGNEYSDVVFPITKKAREQLNNAVIDFYNDMQSKGQESFMGENTPPEKSNSTITASVQPRDYENSHVKGTGQIVIDDAFVVTGVMVIEGDDGSIFASMPSYTNDVDEHKDYAFPITKECYEKVQNAVLEDYAYIQNYHEMGGKENLTTAFNLNGSFADKLAAELSKNDIEYVIKKFDNNDGRDGKANISVKLADKDRFAEIRKDLAQTLQQERQQERDGGKKSLSERIDKAKAQQPEKTAEQAQAKQPHKKPNSQEL